MSNEEAGAIITPRQRAPNTPPARRSREDRPAVKNSELVYRHLRREIVGMVLPPGTPILEKDIAQSHGVSRTPVREAVLRLVEERLVEVVAKSGTYVSRIPLSVLPEALVARRALEAVTVREAARIATPSRITGLVSLVQLQQERAEAGDEEGFHEADDAFHAAIAEAARYSGIWDLVQQVKVHVDRYRRLTLPQPGRMGRVVDEHNAIVEAIRRQDPALAERRMEDHLNKLRLDIAIFRDMWPDYFIHDIAHDEERLR